MAKYRTPSSNSKYFIPKEDYLTAVHYALRYPLWLAELKDARDTSKAIRYDKEKVQTSPTDTMIADAAIRAMEISDKVKMIEELLTECSEGMENWLKYSVCYGLTFKQLEAKGMPYGHKMFYTMRRRFYFELAKKI